MAKTVENLVQWPMFRANTPPPTAAPNGWFVNDNSATLSQVMLNGSAPEFYAGTWDEYAENMGTRLPSLAAGEYTFMIDALIPSGANFTVHTGATGLGTAQNIGSIVGDGVRKIHVFTATTTSTATYLFLRNNVSKLLSTQIYGARVTAGAVEDTLGIFSGDSVDPLGVVAYSWAGTVNESTSTAVYDDAPPEPEPENELVLRTMALLNLDAEDPEETVKATQAVEMIKLMVKAYTRGRGFTVVDGKIAEIADDLESVICIASVRYLANPSGLTYRAGSEQVSSAFNGWTLAESFVLNAYRKRSS